MEAKYPLHLLTLTKCLVSAYISCLISHQLKNIEISAIVIDSPTRKVRSFSLYYNCLPTLTTASLAFFTCSSLISVSWFASSNRTPTEGSNSRSASSSH